jgi:uncharacterized membrane protein
MTVDGHRAQVSGKLGKALKSAIGGAALLARGGDSHARTAQRDAGNPGQAPVAAMLGRAAALGAATGLRSTVALAALVVRRNDGLPAALGHPAAQAAATLACAGELVADKLPATPSRLSPRGLATRLIAASLAAAVLARGGARSPVPAVVIAAAAALAAAKIGHDTRRGLDRRFPDPVVALAEDGLAVGLAALGS